jgi:hypothetical protein
MWLIDTDRTKTEVRRKFILWPETVLLVDEFRRKRTGVADRIFMTAHGRPWVREKVHRAKGLIAKSTYIDSINMLFGRVLRSHKIKRRGMGFGALRHTHISAVGDHPDRNAARLVRGHKIEGIESHYDFPSIKRIKAVTDLARRRLLPATISRPAERTPARRPSRGSSKRVAPHA